MFKILLSGLLLTLSLTTMCSAADELKAADRVSNNQKIDTTDDKYKLVFQELEEQHNFTRQELESLFKDIRIDRKILQLMDQQWEAKPYYRYWPLFITSPVIRKGKKSLRKYSQLFDRIEAKFGVDRHFIVAIWGIESRFGSNQGRFNMFRSLNTLFDAYPRRSDFFRKELIHFLVLCKNNGLNPRKVKGSYAGAFGQAQFMPSSFNAYAVDFDGDNRRDLINSMPDIFASIANYLSTFGWVFHAPVYAEIGTELQSAKLIAIYNKGRKGRVDWRLVAQTQHINLPRPPGDSELSIVGLEISPHDGNRMRYVAGYPNFHAITEYNHSHKYAMAVAEMAEAFIK